MNNKKFSISIIAVLVIAIISLGVAFAAFSTTLNINGSASVESSNWNVYFSADFENCTNPGSNGVSLVYIDEGGTGHIVSTLLTSDTLTWSATFKSPGDYIDFDFYVCNSGDYDADISLTSGLINFQNAVGNLNLTCTQNGVVTQEAATVCSHLHTDMVVNDYVPAHLEGFARQNIIIELDNTGWAQDGSDLPKNPVTVTAAPIVLTATQRSSAH